ETLDKEEAEKLAAKMKKGQFDMNDLKAQLGQMKKRGGMKGVLGMLPGVGKIKGQLDAAGLDDKILTRQEAIIQSMTKKERVDPDLINGSRRKRSAAGGGARWAFPGGKQTPKKAPQGRGKEKKGGKGAPQSRKPRHCGAKSRGFSPP